MNGIGWKNLKRDPLRMLVAICGVVFSVVLVTVELGMLLGLVQNASVLIDRSRADIWISKVDVKTFDFATPFDRRKRYQIESIPGVARVEEFHASYTMWKLPTGGNASVQVVGFDPAGRLGPGLDLTAGDLNGIHNQDAVLIDESEREKLGNVQLGEQVEIMDRRAKVVGFTRGCKSFTTTPFVFTSLRRAHAYGWITNGGRTALYFLVQVREGYEPEAVRRAIQEQVPGIEAQTRAGFSWRTRRYWLLETGVGLGFLVGAFLGLIVGGVIVSQTLFAITVEKLPEFGVLKAMGATMGELAHIVLTQGLVCGMAGFAVGLLISLGFREAAASIGTTVLLPWPLIAAVLLLTAVLCSGASLLSILRLRRIDPALVFRA